MPGLSRYARGKWWESTLVALLRSWGYDARQMPPHSPYDLTLFDFIPVEVKSGLTREKALSNAKAALDSGKLVIAVWGPLTVRGILERAMVLTTKGTYRLSRKGLEHALKDLGLPTTPEELARHRQNLLSSLSLRRFWEEKPAETTRKEAFTITPKEVENEPYNAEIQTLGEESGSRNPFSEV